MQQQVGRVETLRVPETLDGAIDPEWLTKALAPISGGSRVASVKLAQLIKAMASKVRIEVIFENDPGTIHRYCLKAFLDAESAMGGETTLREANFYTEIAPHLTMRTPHCPAVVINRDPSAAILIMDDMIAQGVHFCSALEPFDSDQVRQTLDQLARLHVKSSLLRDNPWIPCRIEEIVASSYFSTEKLQSLMHDARRGDLPERTLDAQLLEKGMAALAERNKSLPRTLMHGDVHSGNVYRTADGPGFTDWQLINYGNWSQDVAYHINAVLPVEIAEREERALVDHYLDAVRRHGGEPVSRETAWEDYRCAQIYGYYHWAITQRVRPVEITHNAFQRLGAGVTRHDTYKLLGL